MASYPYMVQAAHNVIRAVIGEWHRQPFLWSRERDIQAEIGSRLSTIFSLQGLGTVSGDYGPIPTGWKPNQTWSRVAYEPYVRLVVDGRKSYCHPDIVIWHDSESTSRKPDYENGVGWPILWACEIKYGSGDDGTYDERKLGLMVDQGTVDYACAVRVHFVQSPTAQSVNWNTNGRGHRFWTCDIYAPKSEADS